MTWMPDDRELAPGVTVERRSIFWAPLALAAAVLRGAQPAQAATAAAPLNWDDFIRLCPPDAAEWARDTSEVGQDAYLNHIAAWAVRLKAAPDTRLGAFQGLDPKVEFGPSFRGVPFAVIQWRMAPRAVLPAHCHPQASVCTVGMEGEARLRHFEVDGPAPAFDSGSRTPFLIRETRRQIVAPGASARSPPHAIIFITSKRAMPARAAWILRPRMAATAAFRSYRSNRTSPAIQRRDCTRPFGQA
jgi:hypothetical protein